MHFTEKGGTLGGGSDVYIILTDCPLGPQGNVPLHRNTWTKVCGGRMYYETDWHGGLSSKMIFNPLIYVPD